MTKCKSIITYILILFCMPTLPIANYIQNNSFVDYVLSEHGKNCEPDRLCNYNGTKTFRKSCRSCFKCRCDNNCIRFGDCCPDISPLLLASNVTASEFQYYCQSDTFNRPGKYFFSIAKCSSFVDPLLVTLCHNPNSTDPYMSRPVTSASGEIYRNEFCAQCNGETTYQPWNIRFSCRVPVTVPPEITPHQILNYFLQVPGCSLSYSAPNSTQIRRCYVESSNLISSCNETGLWPKQDDVVQRACGTYYSPVLVESRGFKNLFCFYCNSKHVEKPKRLCMFTIPYPFSVLMDPDASNKIITKTQKSCQCKNDKVYDKFKIPSFVLPMNYHFRRQDVTDPKYLLTVYSNRTGLASQKICRPVMCSFGRKLTGKKCVSRYTQAKGSPYSFEVTLTPNHNLSTGSDANTWMSLLISNTEMAFKVKTGAFNIQIYKVCLRSVMKINQKKVMKLLFLVKFVLISDVNLDIFENLLTDIRHSYWMIPYEGSFVNMSSSGSLTLSNSDIIFNNIYFSGADKDYYSWTYAKRSPRKLSTFSIGEPVSYTTVTETLMCPLVQLDVNETRGYSRKDETLVLLVTNTILSSDEFLSAADGTISICQDIVMGTRTCGSLSPEAIFSKEYIIVSTTCQGLSLLCLFMTLVVFFLFPSLRTLPGKTTMGLILTLFFAVGLNLFGISRIENRTVCKIIAVLLHLFLLSSFTWMGICSFHMYRVFKNLTLIKISISAERKLFIIYFMISLLIPVAIISAVIGTNYANHGSSDIGYGRYLCYVSNFYSIIFGVLIPVAIVVFFNFVLFILTVISLRTMSTEHHNLTGKKENVYMYVKLSTLTGLNWSSAFIAVLTGIQEIWYVFVIMCGLQGVYIFLAFVCNKRVFNLFKEMCNRINTHSTRSNSETSTTGNTRTSSLTVSKNSSLEYSQIQHNDETQDKKFDQSTSTDF